MMKSTSCSTRTRMISRKSGVGSATAQYSDPTHVSLQPPEALFGIHCQQPSDDCEVGPISRKRRQIVGGCHRAIRGIRWLRRPALLRRALHVPIVLRVTAGSWNCRERPGISAQESHMCAVSWKKPVVRCSNARKK